MKSVRAVCVGAVSVLLLVLPAHVWAQSGNGTLTGTVEDASGALIPGVSITATNTGTGVTTTAVTNESGGYNIPGLIPGTYQLRAELPGFQSVTYNNIALGTNETKRFNFTLQVGAVAQTVEVIDAGALLTTSNATIDNVLPEYRVRDLPLVGNDVLDLINVLGGARVSALGGDFTTFAGISAGYVNTTINGQSVNDGRYAAGVYSTTRVNPDLVSEVRLVLTPVDAEMGRGNGQVQIQTRSGTNEFRGTAAWDVRNTAFDARSWDNNRTVPQPTRNWQNQNQLTLSVGGPIVKNKTHFFGLFDGQRTLIKETVNATVLTDCARNGIFRFFPDWNNGAFGSNPTSVPTTLATAVRPVVDALGNPVAPATFRNGQPYTGTLQYRSVFGRLEREPTRSDCSDAAVAPGTAWDTNRTQFDSSGFIRKLMGKMPRPNVYDGGGDGLNTAVYRWTRRRHGNDEISGGTSDETDRNQINIRIDHNFNLRHKVGLQWQYERNDVENNGPAWPDGFWGSVRRRPQIWTTNFVSTLKPNLINEARWGLRRNWAISFEALDDPTYGEASREFHPTINGYPLIVSPSLIGNGMLFFGDFGRGNITSLYTYADTVSWTKGQHAIRIGGDFRQNKSFGYSNLNYFPRASGGAGGGSVPTPVFSNVLGGGLLQSNSGRMADLLLFLSGGMGNINQLYFLKDAKSFDRYVDMREANQRASDVRQNEYSFFFKDDWKVRRDLTLNLGLRYEYYGSPWDANGLTPAPVGGGHAVFGISGRNFDDWFKQVQGRDGAPTTFEFVGPNSPNPDKSLWKADRNNFGPAVGFAWQLPWFGAGRTTLRGGYQITYQGGGRSLQLDIDLGYVPGMIFTPNLAAADNTYVLLSDLANPRACGGAGCLPVPHNQKPMQPVPVTYRQTTSGWQGQFYDPNYVAPYIQNFSLALTRSVGRDITVDVRYIGTRGTKLFDTLAINTRNFTTNGLKEAFDAARYGGESELLDRMFNGINVAGTGCSGPNTQCGPVGSVLNGVRQTGAMHLRAWTTTQNNLANGNYSAIAGSLYTANYNRNFSGNSSLPVIPTGVQGAILRHNSFPENFISANPQFNTVGLRGNGVRSNYHAMQAQFTMRPKMGISYQGTFTWARSMGSPPNGGYQDPTDRREYGVLFGHRLYEFKSNGIFELPIGPGKLLLGNSNGWVARLVESWRISGIFNMVSGRPNTITANNGLYAGTGTPIITPEGIAAFGEWPAKFGSVHWQEGAVAGSYFDPGTFARVPDPQCARVTPLQNLDGLSSLSPSTRCTLQALARPLPSGQTATGQITLPDGRPGVIVLRNALPGERGNLALNTMEGPGLWLFDAAMSKTVRISERKTLEFRVDARNVLNHPTPDDPGLASCGGLGTNLSLNNNNDFGLIGGKCVAETPARRFQARVRFTF